MATIKEAVDDLLSNHALPVDEAIDKHFGPGFRQRTNGAWDDRDAFRARIHHLRGITRQATITVLDEVVQGARYAERHIIDLALNDGARIHQEVYLFAERGADGRFIRIEETTLPLDERR